MFPADTEHLVILRYLLLCCEETGTMCWPLQLNKCVAIYTIEALNSGQKMAKRRSGEQWKGDKTKKDSQIDNNATRKIVQLLLLLKRNTTDKDCVYL